jgi:hypothetical protein
MLQSASVDCMWHNGGYLDYAACLLKVQYLVYCKSPAMTGILSSPVRSV